MMMDGFLMIFKALFLTVFDERLHAGLLSFNSVASCNCLGFARARFQQFFVLFVNTVKMSSGLSQDMSDTSSVRLSASVFADGSSDFLCSFVNVLSEDSLSSSSGRAFLSAFVSESGFAKFIFSTFFKSL